MSVKYFVFGEYVFLLYVCFMQKMDNSLIQNNYFAEQQPS